MNIVTKTGDDGTTGLLYGGRLRKDHPLIQAVGDIDELNAALGMLHSSLNNLKLDGPMLINDLQNDLVNLMGEVACSDRLKFREEHSYIDATDINALEEACDFLQTGLEFSSWANPSGPVDLAARVARRAERSLIALKNYENVVWTQVGPLIPVGKFPDAEYLRSNIKLRPILNIYLNRLSDLLWLIARHG